MIEHIKSGNDLIKTVKNLLALKDQRVPPNIITLLVNEYEKELEHAKSIQMASCDLTSFRGWYSPSVFN